MFSDHPFIAVTYWLLRKTIGIPIRILFIHRVSGLVNIPQKGPAIIAFNHQSFFDFLCFAAITPRNIHFLSAEKFFENKWFSVLMFFTGQIRVNRLDREKKTVHDDVAKHVKKGTLIGIFPEGTRSPDEWEMLKAFTGVAQFALRHHIPIIPVGIRGTYKVMAKHDRWPRVKKIVEIHVGRAIHLPEYFDKHNDHEICLYVTECVMSELEKLSGKRYIHYESRLYTKNRSY